MKINESKSRIELFFMVVWFLTMGGLEDEICGRVGGGSPTASIDSASTKEDLSFLEKISLICVVMLKLENFINFSPIFSLLQISLLIEEIARLRTAIQALQESHNVQTQRLEESLDAKRQHIIRLENRIGKSDYDDMKKENR